MNMTHCPLCHKEISCILHSSYGGTVTFYHKCKDGYALVREDGTKATNNLEEIMRYKLQEIQHV